MPEETQHPIPDDERGAPGTAPGAASGTATGGPPATITANAPSPPPGSAPVPVTTRAPAEIAAWQSVPHAVWSSGSTAVALPSDPAQAPHVAPLDGIPPLPRPFIPKPKPAIVPERTDKGYKTAHLELERAAGRAWYVTYRPADRPAQRVYVAPHALDGLLSQVAQPGLEPGLLWRRFSDLPLERPLPSRALEEELRVLLTTFGAELRR